MGGNGLIGDHRVNDTNLPCSTQVLSPGLPCRNKVHTSALLHRILILEHICSISKVLQSGIPFCKTRGFPKLSLCYVTTFSFKTPVLILE